MANVTDSASVLVVPSGWSDGVLGSLQPDDGSSDFTFSRGSDLSATRVNEQGLIEKGYENLLLQSNNFDTSPWTTSGVLTGNQVGYDGSSDAWLFESPSTFMQVGQNLSVSGVQTYSVYAKAGTTDWIHIRLLGDSVIYTAFDLNPSTTGNRIGANVNTVSASIEDVGGGWFRCSLVANNITTTARIYIARDNSTTINVGDNIYIQDAQLNQGLAAYPYIETGITTAKNPVILEDQPRIDYTSGNGVVLIEPQRTNLISYSEYLTPINGGAVGYNSAVSPEGVQNALKVIFGPTTNDAALMGLSAPCSGSTEYTWSAYVKNVSGTGVFNIRIDTDTQGVLVRQSITATSEWTRVTHTFTTDASATSFTSNCRYRSVTDGNEILIWGAQMEQGYPTSYIPTYGTSQTRLKDTATLTKNVTSTGTIYININAQTSRTLTFLGADISVTQGVNKIAMAYSPTALKVSKNGTIVANITRAFDTTALTQIQLGHRNNFEQTTDSINQFLTLDSFLNDTKLNELTA